MTLIVLALSLGLLSACTTAPQVEKMSQDTLMEESKTTMEKPADTMIEQTDARQVDFVSEAESQALTTQGPVVYFFKASWCPTCQALQLELDRDLGTLPAGTIIVTVDYDKETALKKKYAITYQHTLVQIDATGKELSKWQGGGVSEIKKNIVL